VGHWFKHRSEEYIKLITADSIQPKKKKKHCYKRALFDILTLMTLLFMLQQAKTILNSQNFYI